MLTTLPYTSPTNDFSPKLSTPKSLQGKLHEAFSNLEPFSTCALLNYPNYINLGDHLIWLGNLLSLSSIRQSRIAYTASTTDFSANRMKKLAGNAPILLSGGGSLGDIWPSHQHFRENIISQYVDRPIIILPQTIHFQDPENLKKARRIFNVHPNLTVFARDQVSFSIAQKAFDQCHVYLAPDTAMQLTHFADFPSPPPKEKILYHCRTDAELLTQFELPSLPLPVDQADWLSYEDRWVMGSPISPLKQKMATAIRSGWQRGLKHPMGLRSRCSWETTFCPGFILDSIYNPAQQRQSWSFVHSALYQFRQYRLIITNRLHGHLLATLLGIPHIFLPNKYHKNKSFYDTWTTDIPYCKFVTSVDEIPNAVDDLLNP